MTTSPPRCTRKGCRAKTTHHHDVTGTAWACILVTCPGQHGDDIVAPLVAPRLTRKALTAELDAALAQCETLRAELAAARTPAPSEPLVTVEPRPTTKPAWVVKVDGEHAGMVFDNRGISSLTFHACQHEHLSTYHDSQAAAVAAVVAAWKARQ